MASRDSSLRAWTKWRKGSRACWHSIGGVCASALSRGLASTGWSRSMRRCTGSWWEVRLNPDPTTERPRPAVPDANLSGRTVLAVFAHPDDESLACGGTLARLADAGAQGVLLCAPRGNAGSVCDPPLGPDGNLGAVRTRELREAAAVLGIAEVIVMDHPDGELRWDDVPELHAEIVSTIERHRPDAIITFAEDGLYWHLD